MRAEIYKLQIWCRKLEQYYCKSKCARTHYMVAKVVANKNSKNYHTLPIISRRLSYRYLNAFSDLKSEPTPFPNSIFNREMNICVVNYFYRAIFVDRPLRSHLNLAENGVIVPFFLYVYPKLLTTAATSSPSFSAIVRLWL